MRMSRGFTLVELALGLALGGIVLAGVWQLMGVSGRQSEATALSGHALAVARAGNSYLSANSTAVLAQLAAINNVVKIRVTSADTGNGTLTDLQTAGYLPVSFVNQNSYGQSYAFYAQRQDAGAAGADASDRLVGLVITTGGNAISDNVGDVVVQRLGAAGGFMYASDNPAPPTAATTARGAGGGWSLNLGGAGWTTTVGATATAGRIAILATMLSNSALASPSGPRTIDGLDDGISKSTPLNIFLGLAGSETASGLGGNVAAGHQALQSITNGTHNTAFGKDALRAATSISSNTAIGAYVLANAATIQNNALGAEAMRYSGSGTGAASNIAIGYQALLGSTTLSENTGTSNIAVGASVLSNNKAGSNNVAMGNYQATSPAMAYNDNGALNVALGPAALVTSTSNSQNTAIGTLSMACYDLNSRVTPVVGENVAIGYAALFGCNSAAASMNTGTKNTAIGYVAMRDNTSGSENTAIGNQALLKNTDGNNNIAIGNNALADPTTTNNNIAIGTAAMFGASTSSGDNNVAVGNSALFAYTSGSRNVAIGTSALPLNTTGSNNVAIGHGAGLANVTGSNNTYAGYMATADADGYTNSTALGNAATITASNQIVLGNTSIAEIRAQVTSITAISDRRLKHDIAALSLGLNFINRLKPVQFRNDNGDEKLRFGFIAQDVREVLPDNLKGMAEQQNDGLALIRRDAKGDQHYHMTYGELTAPLVKALQELDAEITSVTNELAEATAERDRLRQLLAK